MRAPFPVADDPPRGLLVNFARARIHDTNFRNRLRRALREHFGCVVHRKRPGLPESLVTRTISRQIAYFQKCAVKFPKFRLESDPRKFVRCCYRSVWRALFEEWKLRM